MATETERSKIYIHPSLGEISIINSLRAKRLSLRVKASGEVNLVVPKGCSSGEALRFLEQKKEWVEAARQKIRQKCPQQIITMPYSTKKHTLKLNPCASNKLKFSVRHGVIEVSYPSQINYESQEVQDLIKSGIEEAWREEAKKCLPHRTAQLAASAGFHHQEVTVRNSRTRWGSCSVRNSISLSIHMMKLPDYLIDYVILHELCHTIHKNHGPKFHELLNRVTKGNHQALNRELKRYSTRTY